MKVTFIRPNMFDDRLASAMQVLSFAILKGLTPPDVETVLYDERLERIPYDERTDLVAITVETFTARRAYQIADQYRRRGIPVVVGGFHPSMVPEEAALFADAVVIGDMLIVDADGGVVGDAVESEQAGDSGNFDLRAVRGRTFPVDGNVLLPGVRNANLTLPSVFVLDRPPGDQHAHASKKNSIHWQLACD